MIFLSRDQLVEARSLGNSSGPSACLTARRPSAEPVSRKLPNGPAPRAGAPSSGYCCRADLDSGRQWKSASGPSAKIYSFMLHRLIVALSLIAAPPAFLITAITPALAAKTVFTVGNYPVDATARDAVAAKKQALRAGRDAAFHSLLKRLVPVAVYPRLRRLSKLKSADFIDGIAVRSEQNSRTEYIASLDFSFRPKLVRALLRRQGIPFLEEQAQQVVVIPVYRAPAATAAGVPRDYGQAKGAANWRDVWRDLDLRHSLTPVKLAALKKEIHPDTITSLLAGDNSSFRILTSEYASEFVVLAVAEPELSTKRLKVTLVGRDAVNFFTLSTNYRIQEDLLYTSELAAVVGLGVLEGRWKAVMTPGVSAAAANREPESVRFIVTFANARQWRDIRTKIARTSGVEQMEVAGISARGATVTLQYPGGVEQLAEGLQQQGLYLRQAGGGWLLQGG